MTRLLLRPTALLFLSFASAANAASGGEDPAQVDPAATTATVRTAPRPTAVRRIIADDVPPLITVGPFKYDGAGNIIHMGTDRYTYDEMSRITSGTAVTAQNADTQQFGYDGFGNLKTVTVPNKSILYIDSDPSTNRLRNTPGSETGTTVLHVWGGSYDSAGNQWWSSGTPSYAYDSMNMLTEMTNPRHEFYLYDANDERVATVSYTDTQNAVWRYTIRDEGEHVLRTVTDTIIGGVHSWQQTEDYVYRTGGLLAAITPQGSTETRKHFHLDHLGSPVLITDDNGQRVSSHKYWPFGAEAPGSDIDGERMKFTGHERDLAPFATNGLDYMHARYYSTSLGRFLSVDPVLNIDRALRRTQNWNRYSYVMNNPLRYTDPDGREHVQEPGFTKPLSEAGGWADQPSVSWAFYAQGALLSLAADEFVIGPAVGAAFRGAVGLYEGYQASRALKAAEAAGVFVGKYGSDMAPKAVGFLAKMSGNGALKARVFEAMANIISKLSPGWGASKAVAIDGSHVFTGTAGETLVINAKGQIFRGGINAIKQTKNGVEVVWDALKQIIPK